MRPFSGCSSWPSATPNSAGRPTRTGSVHLLNWISFSKDVYPLESSYTEILTPSPAAVRERLTKTHGPLHHQLKSAHSTVPSPLTRTWITPPMMRSLQPPSDRPLQSTPRMSTIGQPPRSMNHFSDRGGTGPSAEAKRELRRPLGSRWRTSTSWAQPWNKDQAQCAKRICCREPRIGSASCLFPHDDRASRPQTQ